MNWEMAKTWLIASFLVLDLILGWQVYQSRRELIGYVESYPDQLANTKTLLAEHGFSLNASVPSAHPDMSFVRADYATPPLKDVGKVVFPSVKSFTYDDGAGTVQSSAGTLKVTDKGTWKVTFSSPPKISIENASSVLKYVWQGDSYTSDTGLAATDDGAGGGGTVQRVFDAEFNDFPVFDATVTAEIKEHSLRDYTQANLVNMAAVGDKKQTISALDALNNLANTVDKSVQPQDNKILNIALGYYHKIPSSSVGTGTLPTASYWFPVWRVVTLQQVYYVNAFTGEVETPS